MEPTSIPAAPGAAPPAGDAQAGHTRRTFVRGIAASGASTVAATSVLTAAGITDLFGGDEAEAAALKPPTPLSDFRALAASSADELQVPEGFRAYTLIGYGDELANTDGTVYRYGYNNDYLAFFPLNGSNDEGLLFVNHEYPAPFFQNGFKPGQAKTDAAIHEEIESVGNSIVHVKRASADHRWEVVSPSKYNRRVFGGDVPGMPDTPLDITGPLAGPRDHELRPAVPGTRAATVAIGTRAKGTVGNCSGGITPWGTALSCEENYDSYGYSYVPPASGYGWGQVDPDEYDPTTGAPNESRLYGWVCEHDPYDPYFTGRKHTALGRFRHENTAFRAEENKPFVLYMGDDQTNQAVYKFVSSRSYTPDSRDHNLRILTEGTLYVARWAPEGRRRFAADGDVDPISPTSGTGEWVEVHEWELHDTRLMLGGFPSAATSAGSARRAPGVTDPAAADYSGRFNFVNGAGVNEWDTHFATNRPEDVEVDTDGTVYIAFTNNSAVKDQHGAIRKLVEDSGDATALTFTWEDYAEGGPTGRADAGEQGFSSCDNLVIDQASNVWTVTDISSSSLKGSTSPKAWYDYHGNNAVFMIPRSGPNAGVAFRFANMPIEAEGTGPYFTPDERTLFINVQHPGEVTADRAESVYGDPRTYRSYWPNGNKTTGLNPSTPIPTTVAIEKVPEWLPDAPPQNTIPPQPQPQPGPGQPKPPAAGTPSATVPSSVALGTFLAQGTLVTVNATTAGTIVVRLTAKLPRLGRRGTATVTVARAERRVTRAGTYKVRVKVGRVMRARLRAAAKGKSLTATLTALVPGTKKALKDTIRLRG